MLKRLIFPLAACLAVSTAQAYTVDLNDTSRVYDLDEVLVVSQPKEQFRLRLQPISSSMYSSDDLNSLGARDLRELSAYTPNFTMPNYGSRYTSSIYVRGIGSRVNSPAVGIYVDGMPVLSKSAYNVHFYDLQRVDVLRGPQGTLYGLNTEGGLVRLYTVNPMNYQGTDVRVGFGSHSYQNFEVAHYNKVNERFAFSLAGFYNAQHGFFRNVTLGTRADKYKEAGGKLKLVFRPTERWDINFLADYQYVRQNGFPYGLLDDDGTTEQPATNRQGNYRRNIFNTALDLKFRANAFDFTSTTSYQYLKDYMLMDIDYLPQDYMHMEQRQLQNGFTQEFALKSREPVGGFWHWTVGAFGGFQWLKTDAPVSFDDDFDNARSTNIQEAMYNAMVSAMTGRFMAIPGMTADRARAMAEQTIASAGGVSVSADMQTVPGLFHTPVANLGVYHESNFNITSRLTATLGLRYDYSHVKIDYDTQAAMSVSASVMGQQQTITISSLLNDRLHDDFNQLLPKFGLTYRVDNLGSNVYATVSKGYRAGGYNIQMFSDILEADLQNNSNQRADYEVPHDKATYEAIAKTIAYKPETSWNYELGTHLNLFDNKVHFDFTAFFMQVRNQQLSVMAGDYGFGRMMVNAGKSESCGIEASLNGSAFDDRFSWALSYGYTHAVFKNYEDSITVDGQKQYVSYKDNRVPFVPEHTLGARADYRFAFAHRYFKGITLGANVSAQGKTYWDEANTISQKFYAVLGAHALFDMGPVSLNVWARNLTNTHYNTFVVTTSASGSTLNFAERGNPIQWGADLKIHF
jgi:outer membrane receptor protein involved in Fe transport